MGVVEGHVRYSLTRTPCSPSSMQPSSLMPNEEDLSSKWLSKRIYILYIVAICNLGAKGQQLGHPYTMLPTANAGWLYSLSIDPHKVEVKGQFNNN